jgi:hypothetical protein
VLEGWCPALPPFFRYLGGRHISLSLRAFIAMTWGVLDVLVGWPNGYRDNDRSGISGTSMWCLFNAIGCDTGGSAQNGGVCSSPRVLAELHA